MYGIFEDLEIWKACRELRKEISQLVKSFPAHEQYNLTGQLIRSSRSVTASITEGHGRYHYIDNSKFCRNSRGSLLETITAFDEGCIREETLDEFELKSNTV